MTTLDERHAARRPAAVPLDEPTAELPLSAGSKASNLARAARAGLPVLPGFVIPYGAGGDPADLRQAWRELSDDGTRSLVVRSSSPQEDTEESSLAGQFASVLDVCGWQDFRTAVRTVLDSAQWPDGSRAPMAVLVQPMLTARVGGVLFGADPVAGRADRLLVSAVHGGPDRLVGGEQAGTTYWLSRRGRVLRTESPEPSEPSRAGGVLTRAELVRLARLARRARQVFGGPQDIEFGFDGEGRLWLFQSRPITAMAARPPRGARLLGPGPVAETLPDQLEPLEEDLWVAPMARGLAAALDIGGSAPRRLLRRVPVVTVVGGRAAADLRLLGAAPPAHRWLALLNPAPGGRRLAAAWRVGRLTAALPGLATDLVADVDHRLTATPPPAVLPSHALATTLRWTRAVLVSLHAQEALAGALLSEPDRNSTAAGTALAALTRARAQGVPKERVVADSPVVLALMAPSLRGRGELPWEATASAPGTEADGAAELPGLPEAATATELSAGAGVRGAAELSAGAEAHTAARTTAELSSGAGAHKATAPNTSTGRALPTREALRLRIRWVQELQVRLVGEGARRLGLDMRRAGLLRWPEFVTAVEGGPLPADVPERTPADPTPALPDAFRLADGSVVVAERTTADGADGARGVSGGRGVGTVWDGQGPRPPHAVLVVRTLDPGLAPLLPGLTGLVAQTGSPLSHLAVLAREFGLPTVVGAADAVRRFPPGSRIAVDGTTGDVRPEDGR
ncbi:PEP/pyruvate-binding domain-containing protein [Streptomyces olivochromogenes]|uniref:PEP/pyruvate-binding domain-containing protein n=1 Tax=Streptomyces olivochromogenes TaxID=1963 RepID=UPI001F2B6A7B|nr:PEP/pyruvate-binding domain-containing protein [Streptomyces olivochromogenes]MCF3135807.1 pyruvate phosphate dikinase [Streptomyces olivochromogenes]